MNHGEYANYINSRNDLDPDQKRIMIGEDLDRRKRGGGKYDYPEKPTREKFEQVKAFEYNDTRCVAGKFNSSFWVAKRDSDNFESVWGPFDTLEEAINSYKDLLDYFNSSEADELLEVLGLGGEDEL